MMNLMREEPTVFPGILCHEFDSGYPEIIRY